MDEITNLDQALEAAGEDMILRRKVNGTNVDVTIRAVKRIIKRPDVLIPGFTQADFKVVGSMTQIKAANWPGTSATGTAPFITDPAVPRVGDSVVIQGRGYRVESSDPIAVNNVVIRFVLMVKGGAAGA